MKIWGYAWADKNYVFALDFVAVVLRLEVVRVAVLAGVVDDDAADLPLVLAAPDFRPLDALAANSSNAVESVKSAADWPSGKLTFVLPCLMYEPYGPS
jgi:hypothetical protein